MSFVKQPWSLPVGLAARGRVGGKNARCSALNALVGPIMMSALPGQLEAPWSLSADQVAPIGLLGTVNVCAGLQELWHFLARSAPAEDSPALSMAPLPSRYPGTKEHLGKRIAEAELELCATGRRSVSAAPAIP